MAERRPLLGASNPVDPLLDAEVSEFNQAAPIGLGEAFSRGVTSGAAGMRSSFNYADAAFQTLLGDETGAANALKRAREEDMQAGLATEGIQGFDEFLAQPTFYGGIEQAFSFGGQVAPNVAATLATGLGGAVAGVLTKQGLSAASRAIAKDLAEDVVGKATRREALDSAEEAMLNGAWSYIKNNPGKSGAFAGAFGSEYPMMAGESFAEFDDAGVELDGERAFQSLLTGIPLAAIGVTGEAIIAKAFADKALKEAAKGGAKAGVFKQFAKDILGSGVKSGATEATTELAQEEALIRQRQSVDANYSAQEANLRRATALFAGFVAGGGVGAAGGGVASVMKAARGAPQAISEQAQKVAQEAQEMLQQQASNDMSAAMDQAEMFDTSELGQAPTTSAQTETPLDTPTQGSQGDLFDGQPTTPSQPSTPEALADDASFLDEVMSRPVEEQIPVAEPDEQPVTQAEIAAEQQQEAGADPRDFNRVRRQTPVKREYGAVKKGTTNPDIFVGAYYSRNQDTIFVDTEYLKSQFEDKPWANPRVEGVDPIPQDFVERHIRTPDEWVEFVETHELAHTEYPQLQGESRAAYENRINAIAMAEIRDPVGRLPETEFLTEERIGNVQTDARAPGDDSPPLTRTQIRDRAFTESLPAPRAPTPAAPEPVAEGTAELSSQEQEFVERTEQNIEAASRTPDPDADPEPNNTPSKYEVQTERVKSYAIVDDPQKRKGVVKASEEQPLTLRVDGELRKITSPVNAASFYTLKLANHFSLTDAQRADGFLRIAPLMSDAALKRLNELVFDPINGALFTYDVDFEVVGPIEGELSTEGDLLDLARANKDSIRIAITATPTDFGRESSNVFDSTIAGLLGRTDPVTGENYGIGPERQAATPFAISGGDLKEGTFRKFEFSPLIKGGRRANAIEGEALIGEPLEVGDPRTVKAALIRGAREVLARGYQIGYTLNNQFVPLDLDAVFADNFRRATTVPVKITSAVVFDEGGVKYTIGDLLRIDDPRPVDETRSAQDQIRIERSSDEQLANAAAKHLFIANKGMTEDEYDFSFQDTQFRADWARERNRILNTTAEIELPDGRKEIIKPLLEQERKRQLDEVKDQELSQERFRKEEYAGDEGSLEAMSLSAAERAGVFDADKIADARREVVELRSQFGEIIFQQDIPLNSDPFVIAKALDGIKFWPYRSKSNRVSTIQDPAMAALARRIGLNINDPVLEKGQKPSKPLPSVRRRSLSMSQQERIGTRSRLVVEEGRRMGERQDQSVTMSRTPTPLDADRDPDFTRPRLPAKKAGRTKLIGRVFNQGRLSQGVQSIARFADQTLGLTTPVEVVALSTLRDNLENYVGRGRRYSWAGKALRARVEKMTSEEGNVGGVEYMPGRGAIVVVNDTIDAKKFAENDVAMALTVGHEIGHVFFSEQIAAIEANPQLEKRMWDAFRKDRAQPDSPAQYKNDKHGFEEWFSDQVSKFLFDEAVKPQNLVESKFKAAAARLKRFFTKINKMFGGRFTKNTSFEGFMNELLTANSRNNIDSARPLGAATRIESRDLINSVDKEWVKKAERAGQKLMRSKTTGFYKKYISTAKRRLQYMGPAGAAIAAFFSSDSGVAGIRGMLEEAPAMEYAFTNKMVDILGIEIGEGENSWTSERVEKIMLEVEDESIPTEQLSTPEAKKLRALYKEAFEYNRAPDGSQYVQIRERANFGGGRSLSEAAIEQRIDEFIDFLVNDPDTGKARVDFEGKPFMSEKEAELTARYILAQPGESLEIAIQRIQESDYSAAIKAGKLDALYKAFDEAKITPGSANQFVRKLGIIPTKQLRAAGFLEPAGYAQVKYFHHLTRAVEYEKRGGSEFLRSQIENLPEEYKAEASSIIEGFLAKKGQTMKPWLRTFNSATQVHTVLTTLLLAPISSITDLSGIAIRGKSTQNMDLFFKNIMASNKTSANFELAKRIGTIMQEGTDTVFVSQGDQDFSNKWARDIMHKFFKYTGLNLWTRYSRVVAVGMGRDFFIRNAEELSDPNITPARREELMRYMAEGHPDLTAQDVLDWANGSNFGTEAQLRVDAAIRRFADESVVRPNQGQRPSWANDPRFQVLFQLKSFFYAFGDTVVAGAIREGANRYAADGKFTGAAQMALLAGVTLIPLTMLGLEIRELIKYLLQAATPGIEATDYTFRSDYMDTPEYIYEIFSRTGVPGKWTLALTSIESLRWEGALGPIITNVPIFDAFDESVFDGRPFTRNAPVINNIQ